MASRSSLDLVRFIAGAAIVTAAVLACGPTATPSGEASPPPASASGPAGPAPSVAGRDAPPDAVLAAEGGDPVTGQLGTYVWLESGSDSPWLTGAPLSVGAGEPLTLELERPTAIATWFARFVPADVDGPERAVTLGRGTGSPAFGAPGPGDFTVEVAIEFAAGAGSASYFWRLEVE